jgi:hypothetical protein
LNKKTKELVITWFKDPRNKVLVIALAVMVLIVALEKWANSTHTSEETSSEDSADTYIPDGFVLVPIELQNADSLSSLIGSYAVVDLFRGPNSHKVGKRLKLLRAPLNPNQFAVLVPEGEVSAVLAHHGPLWAVIQNPQQRKSPEITSRQKKSRIEYFQGN